MKTTLGLILGLGFAVSACAQTNSSADATSGRDAIDLMSMSERQAKKLGKRDAERDFENGVYRMEVYGMGAGSMSRKEAYLKQRYGVEVHPIAGCIVSDGILGHSKTYNARMTELLNEKHGKDIFEEAEASARDEEAVDQ